jgi:hypothetical protein
MSWRRRGAGFVLSMMVGRGSEGEVREERWLVDVG